MKKNILIFHPALAPYRVDFFNSLARSFNASIYFSYKNVQDQEFDQDILREQSEFTFNYLESGMEVRGRSFRKGIFSKIKKHKPDIILTSEFGPISFLVFIYVKLFRKNTKHYTLSDDSIMNAKERKGIRKLLRDQITKNSSGVIFTSKEVCDWYRANVSRKTKILELPIIHDEKVLRIKFGESVDEVKRNIERYDLKDKIVLLFVGRLVEVKNLPFLLQCFSNIKNENCRLVIVGEGELRPLLERLILKLSLTNKVILTGRKEGAELYSWYVLSQVFIFPSTYERYGAVVNEALVAGCFTLCSNAAGARSLINAENGLVFDPEEESDLTEKLQLTIDSCKTISPDIRSLRRSLMPFSYDEKIKLLIRGL